MSEELDNFTGEPKVAPVKGLSVIWMIPFTALLIGAWIAWLSWYEQGPTITITFQDAEGLKKGKSKIRYRSIDLGTVTDMELSDDRRHVVVTAELEKGADDYLSPNTRFWVVKPQIGLNRISGLQTLLSGSYIAMDIHSSEPGGSGKREFAGLETAPEVTVDTPGKRFRLQADKRGSISPGNPVYFRNIKTGIVTDVELDPNTRKVNFQIFINEPYTQLVSKNTVFWDAGGFSAKLGAGGVEVEMESLETLISGGIAFGLPKGARPNALAAENRQYHLHESEALANKQRKIESTKYTLYFSDSVRGLYVGAPVEFDGIRIGEVLSIEAEYDIDNLDIRIPVTIEVNRGILRPQNNHASLTQEQLLARLIKKGLRASMKTENLLTGGQFIDLTIMDKPAKPKKLAGINPAYPTIPTVSAGFSVLQQRLDALFARINEVPIESIGKNLDSSLAQLSKTLKQTNKTLKGIDKTMSPNSQLQAQIMKTMNDFSAASKAIKDLARMIERNPQSLLLGKPSK